MVTIDYYEILGVRPDASPEDIRSAHRRALRAAHPDHGGTDALFRLVQEAGQALTDPAQRAAYDAERTRPPEPAPAPEPEWVPEPVVAEPEWEPVQVDVAPEPAPEWVAEDAPVVDTPASVGQHWHGHLHSLVAPIVMDWAQWQYIIFLVGLGSLPAAAWYRATELVPSGPWYVRGPEIVGAGVVLLVTMVGVIIAVARRMERRRWTVLAWALACSLWLAVPVAAYCLISAIRHNSTRDQARIDPDAMARRATSPLPRWPMVCGLVLGVAMLVVTSPGTAVTASAPPPVAPGPPHIEPAPAGVVAMAAKHWAEAAWCRPLMTHTLQGVADAVNNDPRSLGRTLPDQIGVQRYLASTGRHLATAYAIMPSRGWHGSWPLRAQYCATGVEKPGPVLTTVDVEASYVLRGQGWHVFFQTRLPISSTGVVTGWRSDGTPVLYWAARAATPAPQFVLPGPRHGTWTLRLPPTRR